MFEKKVNLTLQKNNIIYHIVFLFVIIILKINYF